MSDAASVSLSPTFAEKRSATRVDLSAEVTLESAHNFFTGVSTDISEGGLFVATAQLWPPGSRLNVRFSIRPGLARPVEAAAEVRWVREQDCDGLPAGIGLRFVCLDANVLERVRCFVKQRDTIFYED